MTTAPDFASDTLADLERARSVAVALEQENAELIRNAALAFEILDRADCTCVHHTVWDKSGDGGDDDVEVCDRCCALNLLRPATLDTVDPSEAF